ncbi:HEAT repeat domain-containing protein [Streptacidiphilus fuscans]|uniref:HEAT repeat domain-containing protein n=1 Tax=Streptacidiphilus fuscans TaxID=2789292 RepID=A0A931B2K3_9ACTN|nr:HEAT repeat domain-containing protein [Streptacidiphilus fuscans]MBF9069929.1 HEAT repeat domain-containing protein [Streptacidiphilus fuscans]
MFEPAIAPSASLLGLLQRGRGDGTLHALAAERHEALAALDECVTRDPRRDWQVENRSLYYARLYMELEAPLTGLEEHLFCAWDTLDECESRTGLTLAVLGRLVGYGRRDAQLLLHRYAAHGSNWAWALDELAVRETDDGLRVLAAAVLDRFPEGPEGDAALRAAVRDAYEPRPWHLWAADHPRVAAATERAPFDLWQRQMDRPETPEWSTAAVLAWADAGSGGQGGGFPSQRSDGTLTGGDATGDSLTGGGPADDRAAVRRAAAGARLLAAVAGPGDASLLRDTARTGATGARCAALRHLAEIDDVCAPELIEHAAEDLAEPVAEFALDTLGRMRGARILVHARAWAARPAGGRLARTAAKLLACAGGPEDAPLVVSALHQEVSDAGADGADLCALVEGVGRLAAGQAVSVLRHIYAETVCSQLRQSAARGLAVIDPYFATGAAVECLWDCEEATRELAARHVFTKGDGRVLDRLRRLAADPGEKAEVHAAVRGRLSSG